MANVVEPVRAEIVALEPVVDAYVDSDNPSSNYGGQSLSALIFGISTI